MTLEVGKQYLIRSHGKYVRATIVSRETTGTSWQGYLATRRRTWYRAVTVEGTVLRITTLKNQRPREVN